MSEKRLESDDTERLLLIRQENRIFAAIIQLNNNYSINRPRFSLHLKRFGCGRLSVYVCLKRKSIELDRLINQSISQPCFICFCLGMIIRSGKT